MKTIPEILNAAADRIERDGFHKGGYYKGWSDGPGSPTPDEWIPLLQEVPRPCCTLGALSAEAGSYGRGSDAADVLAESVALGDHWEIPSWNDKASQRKSRVVAALRRAAKEYQTA